MNITVECRRADDGWRCDVRTGDDVDATQHAVTVMAATLANLAPEDGDPVRLVTESFRFLLEREPRESILRTFELPVIGRYFPDWEEQVRTRLARD